MNPDFAFLNRSGYLGLMPESAAVSKLREYYIKLSKTFFCEIEKGKSADELQSLQEEIEKTLLQLDRAEKDATDGA